MTINKFDPTKPAQTRDGRKARIVCHNRLGKYPLMALIQYGSAEEMPLSYLSDGTNQSLLDGASLINVPEKHVRWVNWYSSGSEPVSHDSRLRADGCAAPGRIACIRIEFEEGQFDE